MDGTKRTAFASAMYFLHERGYSPRRPLPKDEIIQFCAGLAEEARLRAEGQTSTMKSIDEIASWLKGLVG
ncbi:MAG: hypothetical protein AB1791_07790 [Chloroflexota bacterium]